MKRTICLITLALFGCSTSLVLGGAKDPCTEKYDTGVEHCINVQSQCKQRGTDPGTCNDNFATCKASCEKAKNECAGKGDPKKTDPKKTTTKTTTVKKTDVKSDAQKK